MSIGIGHSIFNFINTLIQRTKPLTLFLQILELFKAFFIIYCMKYIEFKTPQEISQYAQENKKKLVIFDSYVLDVTNYAQHHPGGSGLVLNYQSKDITTEMNEHHPLSKHVANSMAIGTLDKSIDKIIDADKPLFEQIWKMDHETYLNNVHKPSWVFTKSPRMFKTDLIQGLSYCSWYNIFYVPYLLLFIYYYRYVHDNWQEVDYFTLSLVFIFGLFMFTFTEYVLHRFLFHSQNHLFDLRLMRCTHFILHGIHHMFPFDPYRLVLPPAFTALILTIGYFTVYKLTYWNNSVMDLVFWTGYLTGYVTYDLTHYAIHHIDTSKRKKSFFHNIQKHHNQHHYGIEQAGYGVSTPFWDYIFGTIYRNKKHD